MALIEKPIFVDPLDLGSITVSSAEAGHPASSLNRLEVPGLTWKTEAAPAAIWARGMLDASTSIDFFSILSANASSGTQYRLRLGTTQAEVDGESAAYDSGTLTFIDPAITRDDGLYHSFLRISEVQEATWWRLDITSHTGAFEAAGIVMGKAIEPSRYYDRDFERGVKDLGTISLNRFGIPDKVTGRKMRTLKFVLNWLTEAEYEDTFGPLTEKIGTTEVVYCCFDPAATVWRQRKTYMGILGSAPYASGQVKPRTLGMELQIQSFI